MRIVPALIVVSALAAAQVANMSGAWNLNVSKSKWGKHPRPTSIVITIDHREPALDYSGEVVAATGQDARKFTFHGAIDGKPYPVTGELGEQGKMTVRRVSPNVTVSDFQSDDGKFSETARTTVSSDGKQMVREIHAKSPEGETSWTEVYDRK